ncbi:hypothetical protein GCM10010505_54920 [Kitasatospora aburaviensis]
MASFDIARLLFDGSPTGGSPPTASPPDRASPRAVPGQTPSPCRTQAATGRRPRPRHRRSGASAQCVPAALPGEQLSREVVDYLRTGVAAGMVVPDAADGTLDTLRVVA